jgi:hypothetical protein
VAFARATICVGIQTMTSWLRAADPKSAPTPTEVDTEFMERRAVALADAVVGPGNNIVDWISEQHRDGTGNGGASRTAQTPLAPLVQEVKELVYFGTLEASKGAILFCDALDSIPSALAGKIQAVTFLGKESVIDGIPALNYVKKRAEKWPFPFQFIADLHETSTMDYLRQENRLAVIPTLRESSLYRVLECLVARIAFIASRVGGVTELIAPIDVGKVCFEPNACALCATLCAVLTEGIQPARAAVDARASEPAPKLLSRNSPAHSPDLSHEAAQAAVQALSIDPADAIALKVLARIHLNAGLNEAAREACQLILKGNPKDAEALKMMEEAELAENIIDSNNAARSQQEARCAETLQTFAAGLTAPFAYP